MFPYECFSNIQYFLDNKTLYKCLFVNRYWCRLSVAILWREPFNYRHYGNHSQLNAKFSTVINTLLSCLDENEISSLIPYRLNFNNQTPLFEYGKFVKSLIIIFIFIISWLGLNFLRFSNHVKLNHVKVTRIAGFKS